MANNSPLGITILLAVRFTLEITTITIMFYMLVCNIYMNIKHYVI